MAKFAKNLKASGQKRSGAENAKAELRRRILALIDNPSVFDAFAGHGAMHDAVWKDADRYVGCDLDYWRDSRYAFVADNRRVMRSIDLTGFNIFDFDAFGSPWEQVWIMIRRRPVQKGERLGVILTEGSGLTMRTGGISRAQSLISGVSIRQPGMSRQQDFVLDRSIAGMASAMNCTLAKRLQAKGRTGATMRYVGLVLTGF